LKQALLVSAAAALPENYLLATPRFAADDVLLRGKDRMIVRSLRYLDLEMPAEPFTSWITPVEFFFVRNHMAEPITLDLDSWRLAVTGEVEHPLSLSYRDLKKLASATVVNTLECAGNGRAFFQPHVPGVQWQRGAVGTAAFAGPRLGDVLRRAGLKATAKHVMFRGLDVAPGKVPPFIRSVPLDKALDPDTLLAMQMNGAPLTKHHGFPARALVPGWIGAASVKWLTEARVLDHEFDGNFMKPGYRLPRQPVAPGSEVKPEETAAITALGVKSIIARPADGARLKLETTTIAGAAWAGEIGMVKVEVSTDGGQKWQMAQLSREQAPYAWRLWQHRWKPPARGNYVVMSRATDSLGRTQPATASWNPAGYLWNGIDQVGVHVEA